MQLEEIRTEERLSKSTLVLGLYLFLLPLDFINIGLGSVSKLLSLLVVGVTLLGDIKRMNISFGLISIMALYVCWNCFSIFFSADVSATLERAISLVLNYALIIVCGGCSKNKREIEFLDKSMILSGWFVLILMLFYSEVTNEFRVILMANGQAQDPNYLCGFLIFPLISYLKNIFNYKKIVSSLIALILIMLFVFFTGSRGGMIAILASAICCYLFENSSKQKVQNLILALLFIALIYMIVWAIVPEELLNRYDLSYTEGDRGAGRFDIWNNLIEQYADFGFVKKLLGVGAATVRLYSINVAHNIWIETLFELGIIGVCLLMLMYFAFLRRSFWLKNKIYLAVFIGYLVMSFSMSLYTYKPIFVIFTMINLNFKFETEQEIELLEEAELEDV